MGGAFLCFFGGLCFFLGGEGGGLHSDWCVCMITKSGFQNVIAITVFVTKTISKFVFKG